MNVTRKNFVEILPKILRSIKTAEFVALDLEFTGLPHYKTRQMLDTREERYEKTSQSIQKFFVLQYGISIFKKVDKKYVVETYNVFLSPLGSHETQRSSTRKFEFLASTIDFLSEHNFDFNTTFSKGVKYMTLSDLVEAKHQLEKRKEKIHQDAERDAINKDTPKAERGHTEIDSNLLVLMDEYTKLVNQFLESGASEFLLPSMNRFIRSRFYSHVKPQFEGQCQFITAKNEKGEECMKVIKSDLSDQDLKLQLIDEDMKNLENLSGFLAVLKGMSDAKVPLVFHSAELDLYLTMKQFFVRELPPTLNEFKDITHSIFPIIFDTNLMAKNQPLKNHFLRGTSLGEIYKRTEEQPFTLKEIPIEIKEGFRDYRTFGGQCHEAGFDAFMTGCAFVKMFNFLHVVSKSKQPLSLDLPIAAPFRNRISNNSSYDIIHVSLDRRDKTPKRENCFHIKFPEEWRQSDIYSLFHICGKINIYWIDGNSAYVTIEDHAATSLARSLSKSNDYFIQSYAQHRESLLKSEAKTKPEVENKPEVEKQEPTEKKRRLQIKEDTAMTKLTIGDNTKNGVFETEMKWE